MENNVFLKKDPKGARFKQKTATERNESVQSESGIFSLGPILLRLVSSKFAL